MAMPKALELVELIATADEAFVILSRLHDRIPDTRRNERAKAAAAEARNGAAALANMLRKSGLEWPETVH